MFKNPFRTPQPAEIAGQQLREAHLHELDHTAAAEHHLALARMYRERIQRLTNVVPLPAEKTR